MGLLDYKIAFETVEAFEINLLAYFIGHDDFHYGNKGFIIEDNKITGMTLIDFDNSLGYSEVTTQPINIKYWAGIDNALKILKNIKNFDPNNLNELNSLFIEVGQSQRLEVIKEYIIRKFEDINVFINVGELAVKIINNTMSEDEYQKVIKNFAFPIFETPDNGNIILQSIILRNDIELLVKLLDRHYLLMPNFNKYSTLEQKSVVLSLLNDYSKNKLITQMIIDSNSEVDLKTVLNLMQVNGVYNDFYDVINKLLSNEYRNNNDLLTTYPKWCNGIPQRNALNQIKYIGIIEDRISQFTWDDSNRFNPFKLFLKDEDNYQKNFPKIINKLSDDASKKPLVEFAEMLIANRHFDLAKEVLNKLDLSQLKAVMSKPQ